MTARTARILLCLASILAIPATAASAAAPVLDSVTVCDEVATYRWSLPAGVASRFAETATAPSVDINGYYFPQRNLYGGLTVAADPATSLVDDAPFPAGTYYVHVGGLDTTKPPPPHIEFSQTVKFVVDASGKGTGVDQPGTSPACPSPGATNAGGGGTVSQITPFGKLKYGRSQSVRKLFVTARSAEAGTLKAVASVQVPGAAKSAKVYRFKTVTKKVAANALVKLRLRLSKQGLKAVRRALKRGARLKAKVKVTATNQAGIASSQQASIKLRT